MLVIGLTGGIGTGKSTVAGMLAERGALLLNADVVGHEAYLPHQNVWQEVVDAFGRGILNEKDEVVRARLGEIVFKDPAALKRLNVIVHPWIYRRMAQLIAGLREKNTAVAVLEAALLFEAGWTPLVDQIWVTHAPEASVLERLRKRNGMTPEQITERIRAQMPATERLKGAGVVVDTEGSLDDVRAQVGQLWEQHVVPTLPSVSKGVSR